MHASPSTVDLFLVPLHRWVWSDADRRARKLLRFSETEADGARDITRAAELTPDSSLRNFTSIVILQRLQVLACCRKDAPGAVMAQPVQGQGRPYRGALAWWLICETR